MEAKAGVGAAIAEVRDPVMGPTFCMYYCCSGSLPMLLDVTHNGWKNKLSAHQKGGQSLDKFTKSVGRMFFITLGCRLEAASGVCRVWKFAIHKEKRRLPPNYSLILLYIRT